MHVGRPKFGKTPNFAKAGLTLTGDVASEPGPGVGSLAAVVALHVQDLPWAKVPIVRLYWGLYRRTLNPNRGF